jgi:L-2-hydroxyglutarate oxidase
VTRCDVAVVGGGIVGLAAAREILRRHPGRRLILLEKEERVGLHQTGRNSGVIHSGVYYAPGSLKARLCVAGSRALTAYCDRRGIPYEVCGKVIVATHPEEIPRLEELLRRGRENGVPDLEMIGPERLREIEPHARGLRAIHSPRTGIVDYGRVALAYAEDVRAAGGEILTGREVRWLQRRRGEVVLGTPAGEVRAGFAVTCAGLHSDRLAEMDGAPPDLRIVPFRGDYYVLRPEREGLVRGLIYPVPDPSLPFLGVHLTRRMGGGVWAGPNAVLAFAREGYRTADVNPRDLAATLSFPGFWALGRRCWRVGATEMARDLFRAAFARAVRRYVPEIRPRDLVRGPAGVRAQALDVRGRLVDDFVVHVAERAVHVRNAPSPAATSSLAIAALIADRVDAAWPA